MLELIMAGLKGALVTVISSLFTKKFLIKALKILFGAIIKKTKNTEDDELFNAWIESLEETK